MGRPARPRMGAQHGHEQTSTTDCCPPWRRVSSLWLRIAYIANRGLSAGILGQPRKTQNGPEPGIAQRRSRERRAPEHGNTFLKRQIPTGTWSSAANARFRTAGALAARGPTRPGIRARGFTHGLLAVFGLLPGVLAAQTGGVEGRILDADGPPVFAANLVLALPTTPDQVERIAESDRFGYFRIESLLPGQYLLRVERIGYGEVVQSIEVVADRRIEIDVTLTASPVELEGIAVSTAETRERSRFLETAGVTVREISQAELRLVPGLAEADPIRAVEVLPGVVSTSDFTASFNVRGGSADQNLILLDGVPIFNPFHLGGIFSVFNADMVGRVELSSGGFPAEHGGRVSSLLLVESDPGTDDFSVRGGVSLLAARAALGGRAPEVMERTLGLQRLKWRASGRRSWFDQLPGSVPYHLTDFQGVVEGWTAGGSRILITAYTGDDVFNLTEVDEDDEDGFPLRAAWEWGNDLIGMRWTIPRRDGGAFDLRAGYTRFNSLLAFPDFSDTEFSSGISQLSVGAELEHAMGRQWTFKSGVSADRMTHLNLVRAGGTQFTDNSGEGWLGGAFAHAEWRGGLAWLVEAGVRADRWAPTQGDPINQLAPRLAVKRFLHGGDIAVKAAAGRFTQFLHSARDDEVPIGIDVWVLTGHLAPHIASDQAQVGVDAYFPGGWFASLEVYERYFDGVTTFNPVDDPNRGDDDLLPGSGRSRGIDLFLRRTGQGLTGWVSASWLRATRTFPNYLSGRQPPPDHTYPPIFDRRLDLDVVLRIPLPAGMRGGVRWNLGTGLPYTRPLASFVYFSPQNVSGGRLTSQDDEANAMLLGPRNGTRYPAYHRLDLSMRRTFTFGWGTLTPHLDVLNVYNRKNVLFYFFDYSADTATRSGLSMFPILPTLGVEVTF